MIEEIDRMPSIGPILTLTTILHLLLYEAIFTPLVASFGILGIHQGEALVSRERRRADKGLFLGTDS